MLLPLSQAPFDTKLIFAHVADQELARRFSRLGIARGDGVMRLGGEAEARPVRVRTPKGVAVLAAGMAAKIIVHHDDGHKTPIGELQPGECGHVEGLVCCTELEQGLSILGLYEDALVKMEHAIPPMNYTVLKDGMRLILTESQAAKIWGGTQGSAMQFVVSGRGAPFVVTRFLGGQGAQKMLRDMGITPGTVITLEGVRPASSTARAAKDQNVLQTHSGLRLYLRPDMEGRIMVDAP